MASLLQKVASRTMRCSSWNLAAINNNPFEYWISHDEPQYEQLMVGIQDLIDNPQDRDVTINQVFTPQMFDELCGLIAQQPWTHIDESIAEFRTNYSNRKIISEFLKDEALGAKRLISMPDRMTNTINLADGSAAYRPTVINMYDQALDNTQVWWEEWKKFMFVQKLELVKGEITPAGILTPIKRSKYPDLTDTEEQMSLPLQTMMLAVFDCILVHMMNTVASDSWNHIKHSICQALGAQKSELTLNILASQYSTEDIVFLQEASGSFVDLLRAHEVLSNAFHIFAPSKLDAKRDQNSLVLLSRTRFPDIVPVEVTEQIIPLVTDNATIADGDLCALEMVSEDTKFLIVSFHGDSNGLCSIPLLNGLSAYLESRAEEQLTLVLGADMNAYFKGKTGKKLGVDELVNHVQQLGLSCCASLQLPGPLPATTFNARTYLQPQLNKAVGFSDRATSALTDRNPKDMFIVTQNLEITSRSVDTCGTKQYVDQPIPTLQFPSDHAVLSITSEFK